MKKLLLILFASTAFLQADPFYTANQRGAIQQGIDEWFVDYVQVLNFEDTQILGNYLHVSALAANLDHKTKRLWIKMQPAFQTLQENAFDQHDTVQKDALTMLNKLLPIMNKLITVRAMTFKRWYVCITWINNNGSEALQNALKPMHQHIQQELKTFLKDNKATFNATLKTAQEVAKNSAQLSHAVANTYQALLDGNSPEVANNTQLQDVFDLDTATKLGEVLEQQNWRNMQSSHLIFERTLVLQRLSSELYSMYYKTAYTPNVMIMFDTNGLLPKDKWVTPLPKPE